MQEQRKALETRHAQEQEALKARQNREREEWEKVATLFSVKSTELLNINGKSSQFVVSGL